MNILFFTSEYNHQKLPSSGGAGTFIRSIAQELSLHNHKVYVFGMTNKKTSFKDGNIEVYFCEAYQKRFIDSFVKKFFRSSIFSSIFFKKYRAIEDRRYWANELKKFCVGKNIDIIEAWDYRGDCLFLNKVNIPVVIRCHGSAGVLKAYFNYFGFKDFIIDIEKKALQKFNNIIAVSEYSKKINKEFLKKNKIDVIYNGVDTNLFKPIENSHVLDYSIFYFGTVSERKGVLKLAKIFNEIIKDYPSATLHIIGRGEEYFNYLKNNIFNLNAINNAKYYGVIERELLPQILSKAHVIVFPTMGENFPFSFLEAMALQKPVIVSDIEVSYEIIKNNYNGYIANSKEEFIDNIKLVFNSQDDKVAIEARKSIVENFSISTMIHETLSYYENILKTKQ